MAIVYDCKSVLRGMGKRIVKAFFGCTRYHSNEIKPIELEFVNG